MKSSKVEGTKTVLQCLLIFIWVFQELKMQLISINIFANQSLLR